MRNRMNVASLVASFFVALGIWVGLASEAQAVLEAYWNFNETAGLLASDSSGNAHTGILQNFASPSVTTPTWDPSGKFGGAVNLDGLNDYVQVADTSTLKYSGGDMTLSTWVYVNPSESTTGYIISKPWNASGQYNYTLTTSAAPNSSIGFGLASSGGGSASISSGAIASFAGSWHQITAVADSSKNMTLYVDGVQKAAGVHTIATTWNAADINRPLALGTLYPYGSAWVGNTGFSTDGKLDDLGIFTQALTPGEAKSIFSLAVEPRFEYDLGEVNQLIQAFGSSAPSVVIGDDIWMLIDDGSLTSPIGSVAFNAHGDALLNFANGNGFILFAAPEPSTFVLGLLGSAVLFNRRRRARRAC